MTLNVNSSDSLKAESFLHTFRIVDQRQPQQMRSSFSLKSELVERGHKWPISSASSKEIEFLFCQRDAQPS